MDICVSVWVYAFMWVQCHRKSEEGTRFSGAGVRTYLRDPTWMLGLALLFSWQSENSLLLRHLSNPFLLVLVSIFLLCISEILLPTCGNTYNYLNGKLFSVLQQLSAHLWVFIFSTGKLLKLWWRCIFFCLFILSLVCLFETVSVAQLPASIFEMLHSIGNRMLTAQWTLWCHFYEITILAGVRHWCDTIVWGSPQPL